MTQPRAGRAVVITCTAIVLPWSASAVGSQQCSPCPGPVNDRPVVVYDSLHSPPGSIDPIEFFEQLVERYRTIGAYEDRTHVVEVTTPSNGDAQTRETDLQCEITSAGELRVQTPGASLLADFGVRLPFIGSVKTAETRRAYNLWQAPHLGLRFMADPLREFRIGSPDGFTATRARPVKIGKRELVQIELEAAVDSGGEAESQFDLYVDPESMLVERIEGRELLSDGATYETTLQIEPRNVRDIDGALITSSDQIDEPGASSAGDDPPGWVDGPPMQTPRDEPVADEDDDQSGTLPAVPPT